ncbi:hypothetical protein [Catellatospora sp. NPDC049609]|uniref:hypothetical protein n=1 Tax=Catellatospora sp. NPDC049609 TaxID=3155505 RepID=UPI00342A9568
MNAERLGYQAGRRRGRVMLTHPATGWRISISGEPDELARVILRAAASDRPGAEGVHVHRAHPLREEMAAIMRRKPRPR